MTARNKNIPGLRFKEFNQGWETKKLSELTTKISDGLHSTPIYDDLGEYYFVNGNNLLDGKIIFSENTKRVNWEEFHKHKKDLSDKSILISINGTIGSLGLYNDEKIILGKSAGYLNLKANVDKYYVYNILQSSKVINFFISELTGSTIKNLSLTTIKNCEIFIPSLPEQQKIASFLSATDEKIRQLSRRKELLEQYKKGVMQQLFSGKLRFKDEKGNAYPKWEEKKLGDVAEISTGSSNRQDSGLDGKYTFFDRSQDIRTSSIYLFDGEAVIVAGEGQEFIPKYFVGKFDLHQRTYAIMNFKNLIGKYIFYYIYYNRSYFFSQAVGSTVKSLRLPMFQTMNIKVPHINEQQKIANFLSSLDTKIENVSAQIARTQEFKKGLLQKMFV